MKEQLAQSTLMKKTKQQLIELILRKDAVEREKNEIIKQLNNTLTRAQSSLNDKNTKINNMTLNVLGLQNKERSLKKTIFNWQVVAYVGWALAALTAIVNFFI